MSKIRELVITPISSKGELMHGLAIHVNQPGRFVPAVKDYFTSCTHPGVQLVSGDGKGDETKIVLRIDGEVEVYHVTAHVE